MRLSGENSFGHSGTHGVGCLGVLGWGGIAFVELAHMVDATHCWVGWVVGTVQIVPCANATRFAINALWPKTGPDKPRWTSVPSRPLPKLCLFQLTLRIGYRHRRNQQNASGTRIKKGRIRIRLLPPNLTPQNIHRYIVWCKWPYLDASCKFMEHEAKEQFPDGLLFSWQLALEIVCCKTWHISTWFPDSFGLAHMSVADNRLSVVKAPFFRLSTVWDVPPKKTLESEISTRHLLQKEILNMQCLFHSR